MEYKCEAYGGIDFKLAPKRYPSSKKCNKCGNVKKFLSLSERVYCCDFCNNVIDRDFNAFLNLRDLAFSL